jgi:hypothetical protein
MREGLWKSVNKAVETKAVHRFSSIILWLDGYSLGSFGDSVVSVMMAMKRFYPSFRNVVAVYI